MNIVLYGEEKLLLAQRLEDLKRNINVQVMI